MPERSITYRLGMKGGSEVRTELKGIGETGAGAFGKIGDAAESSYRRAVRAHERAVEDAAAADRRLARSAERIAAFMPQTPIQQRIDTTVSTGFSGASARDSAEAFKLLTAEQERYARQAAMIRDMLNPAAAAQRMYTAQIREAKDAYKAGALTLDEYLARVRQLQAAHVGAAGSMQRVTGVAGQTRAGMQQLSFQLNDIATQYAAGTSASIIFAQQSGQVIQALQMMNTSGSRVLTFLAGWQGMLITTAAVALTPFIAKLFEESEASKEAAKALEAHRKAALALADAQVNSLRAQEENLRLTKEQTAANFAQAKSDLAAASARLEKTRAAARESLEIMSGGGRGAAEAATVTGPILDRLRAMDEQAGRIASEFTRLQAGAENAERVYQRYQAQQQSTPEGRLGLKYDRLMSEADRIADPAARKLRYDELIAARQKEEKALQDGAKALRASTAERERAAKAELATPAAISKMLRDALPGVQITSTTGGKHVPGSYHYKGQAVDFVPKGGMGSMTKEDVRRIFAARGVNIVELLGPGDKGHSDHFHVAWTRGKAALDNFTQAAKDAAAEKRDLMQLLGLFDPAGEAAAKYADQIERIAKLVRSGDLSDVEASGLRRAARLAKFDADAAPPPNSDAVLKSLGIDTDSPIPSLAANYEREQARLEAVRNSIVPVIDAMDRLKLHGMDAIDAITDPANWDRMGDVAQAIIQDIMRDLIRLAVANPLKNLLGMTQGDGSPFPILSGGLFGSLFGKKSGGGNGIVAGDGGVTSILGTIIGGGMRIPKFALGTNSAPGGLALVGELGPELVGLPRGARVHTAQQTRQMMAGSGTTITYAPTYHAPGADSAAIARLEAMVARDRAEFQTKVVTTVADARQRRLLPA